MSETEEVDPEFEDDADSDETEELQLEDSDIVTEDL